MKKRIIFLLITVTLMVSVTGCKQDNMDDIDIAVTNYPNEYIVSKLYKKHAKINRVYPDDVEINKYKVSKKLKNKVANMDLFIYTGLVKKERELAVDLLDVNSNLKIIDTSYVLETDYSTEELWLNPSSLLMMAQNVRLGLKEYVTNTYLIKEIDSKYNKLKIELSELDANYRLAVENTSEKTIVVEDRSLKFLEKFGLKVLCLDEKTTDKEIAEVEELFENDSINYVFKFKKQKDNSVCSRLLKENNNIKTIELNKLDNISDKDRDDGKTYTTLMTENLDSLKQELYQ